MTRAELLAQLAAARGAANSRLPDNTEAQITPDDVREAFKAIADLLEAIIESVQHFDAV